MLHAEALLLVDDHETEVLEHDVALDEAVGADQDVDLAPGDGRENPALFGSRAEAAEHLDGHGVAGHALAEGVEVLLGEDGGGHQHRHLPAVQHRLEGGADGHLGLAVTDVAADQAVHRARLLHVGLGLVDGPELVGGFGEGERRLEFALPGRIGRERVPGLGGAPGLDFQQLRGQIQRGPLGGGPGLLPAAGADAAQLRARPGQADIPRDQVRFLQRHVQRDLVVEFEGDDLAQAVARLDFGQAAVEGDAVLQMDDEVALDELGEVEQLVDLRRGRHGARVQAGAALPLAAEDLGLRDEHQAGGTGRRRRLARKGEGQVTGEQAPAVVVAEFDAEAFVDRAAQEMQAECF